jgi:hypothetical protein
LIEKLLPQIQLHEAVAKQLQPHLLHSDSSKKTKKLRLSDVAVAAAAAPQKLWILKEHKLGAYERHTSILTATSDGSESISQSSPPLDFCKSLTAACEIKRSHLREYFSEEGNILAMLFCLMG